MGLSFGACFDRKGTFRDGDGLELALSAHRSFYFLAVSIYLFCTALIQFANVSDGGALAFNVRIQCLPAFKDICDFLFVRGRFLWSSLSSAKFSALTQLAPALG